MLPPHPADTDTTMLIKVANKNAIPWHMPWGLLSKLVDDQQVYDRIGLSNQLN